MASAMTSPTAKLTVMKDFFNTESAHTAINNVISRKKLSEGEKTALRTTLADFIFIVKNEGKKADFPNEKRETIWQALEYLKSAANIKFLHGEIQKGMEGLRPGVLAIGEDDEPTDDYGLDNDSVHGGDEEQGSIDDDAGSDDDGGAAVQDSPFKTIQSAAASGSYLFCQDRTSEAPQQKRKGESTISKAASSKKPRVETSAPTIGTYKVRDHPSKYAAVAAFILDYLCQAFSARPCQHPIGIDISDSKTIYLGKHPNVEEQVSHRWPHPPTISSNPRSGSRMQQWLTAKLT